MRKVIFAALTYILMYSSIYGQILVFHFEQDTNCEKYFYIDSTVTTNIWNIGKPNKSTFTSAYSIPNALVTDTTNTYPPNNLSSFILRWKLSNPIVVLDYGYYLNTDTLTDYTKIESSVNGGLNWIDLSSPNSWYHQWDIMPIFSGNTKGWKAAALQFDAQFFNAQFGDTVLFKFSFISDSINTQKDGWMIDDLIIWDCFGIGIDEIFNSNKILNISPNPFSQSTQITLDKTYHNIALAVYDIQGKQVAQQQYADCDKIQLNRNQLSNGLYFLKLTLDDKAVETGKIVISGE